MSNISGQHLGRKTLGATSTLSNFCACRDVSGSPDNCSSWVTP